MAPGLDPQAPGQGPGDEPVSDAFVVPAVNDAQDLPGVEVNDGCHPWFMPDPRAGSRIAEEPHGREAVLINAQHPRTQFINLGQGEKTSFSNRSADGPPRDPERRGGLGHCPAGADHRGNDMVAKPAGGPGTAWDLERGFEE